MSSRGAVVGCQAADTVTTLHGISLGAKEANPIVAWIMEKSGTPGFIAVKVGVTLVVLYHYPVISSDLLAVANGVTCAAAAHNMRVANQLGGRPEEPEVAK